MEVSSYFLILLIALYCIPGKHIQLHYKLQLHYVLVEYFELVQLSLSEPHMSV